MTDDTDEEPDYEAVLDALATELHIEVTRRLRMRNAAIRYRRKVREIKRLFVNTATRKDRQLDEARGTAHNHGVLLEAYRIENEQLRSVIRGELTMTDGDIDEMLART